MGGSTSSAGGDWDSGLPAGVVQESAQQALERARRAVLRRQISRDRTMRAVQAFRPSVTTPVRHACCQWPLWGDERPRQPLFCSAPVQPGSSFCAAHHARVWVPAA